MIQNLNFGGMKKLLFVLIFVAAALPLFPQEWEIKLEDYYTYSKINNSIVSREGDVLLVGCVGNAATERNSCIMNVSQNGDIDIHVFPNDTLCTALTNIVQLENGNYFASGVCSYYGRELLCPLIMVLDEDFNMLVERCIDVCGDTYLKYGEGPMAMDDDGNIIITCDVMVSAGEVNEWGCVLIKFSGEGEELKRNYITDDYHLRGLFASNMLNVPNSDEILVLGEYSSYYGMTFFDSDLNFLRGYKIPIDNFAIIGGFFGTFSGDGRLVMSFGAVDEFPNYPYVGDTIYARIATVDLQGELTAWQDFKPTTGGRFVTDCVRSGFSPIDDSHFYVLANEEHWSCGPKDPHLILMDTDMNVIGHKILPTVGDTDYPEVITHTPDGSCILCINYHTSKAGSEHIMKFPITDFAPDWSIDENETSGIASDVYPNPATDALHLNIDENATLSITDIQGRRLLEKNVSEGDNEIDISGLRSGMYIYQVSGDNSENKIGKFIKK